MKSLIIIPILNEIEHISNLINRIQMYYKNCHVLIVDGGSTDGSVNIIKDLMLQNPNIYLKIQELGSGFGQALKIGFEFAVLNNFDNVITMDGDGSHDPSYIEKFLSLSDNQYNHSDRH